MISHLEGLGKQTEMHLHHVSSMLARGDAPEGGGKKKQKEIHGVLQSHSVRKNGNTNNDTQEDVSAKHTGRDGKGDVQGVGGVAERRSDNNNNNKKAQGRWGLARASSGPGLTFLLVLSGVCCTVC